MNKKIIIAVLFASLLPSLALAQNGNWTYETSRSKMMMDLKEEEEFLRMEKFLFDMHEKTRREQEAEQKASCNKEAVLKEAEALPAEQKAKYDKLAKEKKFDEIVKDIKELKTYTGRGPKAFGTITYYHSGLKYYILKAVVKVDGKGLVSFGSSKVAKAIMDTTPKYSYTYKEAEKVKHSIEHSGMAL